MLPATGMQTAALPRLFTNTFVNRFGDENTSLLSYCCCSVKASSLSKDFYQISLQTVDVVKSESCESTLR